MQSYPSLLLFSTINKGELTKERRSIRFNRDFQKDLDQSPTYWEDFGRCCTSGLLLVGTALNSEQLDGAINSMLARVTQDTGAILGPEQRDAFMKGMREEYHQKSKGKKR
jgi:hypothetical protein